jgi:serine/threonine protein kinase
MTPAALTLSVEAGATRPAGADAPRRLGPWELTRLVATGPLTQVYQARPADQLEDRPAAYAVKMLRSEWQDDPRGLAVLCREAAVARGVHHPHLISLLATGLSQPPYYLVTPWLEGATLADGLSNGAQFDLPAALWLVRQAVEALDALHQAGWNHGDVKPSNLFVSPNGHVTLLDLGFARHRDEESGSVVERLVMGTCAYIAPEAITSAFGTDIRSDLYSLGVVLFELLARRLPFEAANLTELVMQHKQARPPDLRKIAPQLPTGVIRLVREMLAKDPVRRPQTPGELIERLVALEVSTFSERAYPGSFGCSPR